jgi:hypothetical protein
MNKWIPISLIVFFGIYLLTTARASFVDYPFEAITAGQPDQPVNLVQSSSR